jgi:hypothetical protein
MRHASIVGVIFLSFALVGTSGAAEKTIAKPAFKKPITGGAVIGPTVGTTVADPTVGGGTVVNLNASDCRLDGGTVVVPSDDRCGSVGAPYCRKPDGWAGCLTQ